MGSAYEAATATLRAEPRRWLVTGAAGFIGSHLVATLLDLGQEVVALDNLETGHRRNIRAAAGRGRGRLTFVVGDIRSQRTCRELAKGCRTVLHHAALGSVPKSLDDPAHTNAANVDGFVSVLLAARDAGADRVVYASSSAVYGDCAAGQNVEDRIGAALSPYAVTKRMNELWAGVFGRAYGVSTVGLRYFNVFGPRQDPRGAYAAVVPRWIHEMIDGRPVTINGDGRTSRDFCFVGDVVQANILAALAEGDVDGAVPNVGSGATADLNTLHETIADALEDAGMSRPPPPRHGPFRDGDIRHSAADIGLARRLIGFEPRWRLADGLRLTVDHVLRERGVRPAPAARHASARA